MKNVKFIAGFSIFGFLLSILSSFGAHRNFGMKLVLALVFAAVFGACAFLISFLYSNFLETDTSGGFSEGVNPAAASSGSTHAVDITVQDEDLPSEENENQFFVGSKHQMLNDDDIKSNVSEGFGQSQIEQIKNENQNSSQPGQFTPASVVSATVSADSAASAAASPANTGFVPVSLTENADNFSSIEAKTTSEVKAEEKVAQMNAMPVIEQAAPSGSGDESLDVLPDLEEISSNSVYTASAEDGVAEETDFTEGKNISSGSGTSAEEVTQGKDAEIMAKAISTLLAKE